MGQFELWHDAPRRETAPRSVAPLVNDLARPAELDEKLPAILAGKVQARDAAELIELAELCRTHKKLPATAVGFFQKAFTMNAKLASVHQYRAAAAAVLAAGSQGKDLGPGDRTKFRPQALTWLKAQLLFLQDQAPTASQLDQLQKELRWWQSDPSLASVREPEALANLPKEERQAWQAFWTHGDKTAR